MDHWAGWEGTGRCPLHGRPGDRVSGAVWLSDEHQQNEANVALGALVDAIRVLRPTRASAESVCSTPSQIGS
jgi:hypothetical protein